MRKIRHKGCPQSVRILCRLVSRRGRDKEDQSEAKPASPPGPPEIGPRGSKAGELVAPPSRLTVFELANLGLIGKTPLAARISVIQAKNLTSSWYLALRTHRKPAGHDDRKPEGARMALRPSTPVSSLGLSQSSRLRTWTTPRRWAQRELSRPRKRARLSHRWYFTKSRCEFNSSPLVGDDSRRRSSLTATGKFRV